MVVLVVMVAGSVEASIVVAVGACVVGVVVAAGVGGDASVDATDVDAPVTNVVVVDAGAIAVSRTFSFKILMLVVFLVLMLS